MIPVFRPSMDAQETNEVKGVLESGWVGLGPKTEEFEKALEVYLGNKHIITTNSATAALHLALIVAGVTEGDEVISPSLTFVSTNHVILYQKATPVFCDADPETLCADPKDVIKKITSKTKAIIVVHYGGHAVDMDPILKIARHFNLKVIEDATESLGALYKNKQTGSLADVGCFSFNGNKIITTGGGGMILSSDTKKLNFCKHLSTQAKKEDPFTFFHDAMGFNYRLSNISAAFGVAQMESLNEFIPPNFPA